MASERRKQLIAFMQTIEEARASGADLPADEAALTADRAELLALLIARARAERIDETIPVEVLLKQVGATQEELAQLAALFAQLGYAAVSKTMRRLARSAPSRPRLSFAERMAARSAERRAMRAS